MAEVKLDHFSTTRKKFPQNLRGNLTAFFSEHSQELNPGVLPRSDTRKVFRSSFSTVSPLGLSKSDLVSSTPGIFTPELKLGGFIVPECIYYLTRVCDPISPQALLSCSPLLPRCSTEMIEPGDESTIYPRVVRRGAFHRVVGLDPFFRPDISQLLFWLNSTDGGRDIPNKDESIYANEYKRAHVTGRLERVRKYPGNIARDPDRALPLPDLNYDVCGAGCSAAEKAEAKKADLIECDAMMERTEFDHLGPHAGLRWTGVGDRHRCSSCRITLSSFELGDTFFNQHVYHGFGCAYLMQMYSPRILEHVLADERDRHNLVAHPDHVAQCGFPEPASPGGCGGGKGFVNLYGVPRCVMCNRLPNAHRRTCAEKTAVVRKKTTVDCRVLIYNAGSKRKK